MYVVLSDTFNLRRQFIFITMGRKRSIYIVSGEEDESISVEQREFPNILHSVYFKEVDKVVCEDGIIQSKMAFRLNGHYIHDHLAGIHSECLGDKFHKDLKNVFLDEKDLAGLARTCVERFFATAFRIGQFSEGKFFRGIMPGDNPSHAIISDNTIEIQFIGKGYSARKIDSEYGEQEIIIKKED